MANRPILCHALDALLAAGVGEVAVLTPADLLPEIVTCVTSEAPQELEVRCVVYGPGAEPTAALGEIAGFAGEAPTIVHRADGLLGQPLGPFLEMLEREEDCPELVLLVAQGARNAERVGPATQRMLRIAELDPVNGALGIAGVSLLGPGAFGRLARAQSPPRSFEPGTIAESLIECDCSRVQVRVAREWHGFHGDALDLLAMNRTVLDGLEDRGPALQSNGNRFEGRVVIDPTASVTSSVICGPVIVGAGAHVADSYIGPHTSIGERVHVEGAEIERSIVLAGASILHVGGRLVASVVGREARIFRDFSMPRAMRLQVGDGDEVALC